MLCKEPPSCLLYVLLFSHYFVTCLCKKLTAYEMKCSGLAKGNTSLNFSCSLSVYIHVWEGGIRFLPVELVMFCMRGGGGY
jgi:hypothetical protein